MNKNNPKAPNAGGQCQWGCASNPGYCGISGQPQRLAELVQKHPEQETRRICALCGDVLVPESTSQKQPHDPNPLPETRPQTPRCHLGEVVGRWLSAVARMFQRDGSTLPHDGHPHHQNFPHCRAPAGSFRVSSEALAGPGRANQPRDASTTTTPQH